MEVTKEQIKYIDHRLENNGLKYWDIRIEMVDHVVSDLEKNAKTSDFKIELDITLKRIGGSRNVSHMHRKSWQNTNRHYRKIYHQGFIDFFKNYLNLFVLGVFLLGFYFLSEVVMHKTFLKVSYSIFLSPIVLHFYLYFKAWRKKYGKSVHRDYAFFYLIVSFLILNGVMNFMKVDGDFAFPITYHKPILFFILPLHLILVHAGYGVYKKGIGKVENIRKQLLS
jgi:hypothetical protein